MRGIWPACVGRVEEALERVWTLKKRVFAKSAELTATWEIGRAEAQSLAKHIADRAIELSRHPASALPFDANKSLVAILLKPFETAIEPPEQPLAAELRKRFKKVRYAQLGPYSNALAYQAAWELALAAEQLLVAIIVRPAAWHAFGLWPQQKELIHRLLREHPNATLASLGVPHALDDFPEATSCICAYSDIPASQLALVDFLLESVG